MLGRGVVGNRMWACCLPTMQQDSVSDNNMCDSNIVVGLSDAVKTKVNDINVRIL